MGSSTICFLALFRRIHKIRAGFLCLLLSATPFFTLSAQEQLLPVFHFQQVQGLPSVAVWSRVVRDSLGFVWIGTVNGLFRYDGYSLKEYRDAEQISSNLITSIFCDSKNRIWVGTDYGVLGLYDRSGDRFVSVRLPPGDSGTARISHLTCFVEDRDGNIWFSAAGGIVRIEIPTGFGPDDFGSLARNLRFTTIPIPTPHHLAYGLCCRNDGTFIAGTDSGLIVINPASLSVSRPRYSGSLARRLDSLYIDCLADDPDGTVWIGTTSEGLYRLDWERGTATNFRHRDGDSRSIRGDDIYNIELDQHGNLWVGTIKGFDLFSTAEGRCLPYLTYGPGPGGGGRQGITVDNTGTVWFSCEGGVLWLSQRSFLLPDYSLKKADGWPRSFQSVERDRHGAIWCMSEGKLFQMDISAMKTVRTIDVLRGKSPDYSEGADRTTSLLDRHGDFWYAAWDLGLYKTNLSTSKVESYNYRPFVGGSSSVRSIAQGPGDSLWIGTNGDGPWVFDPVRAGLSHPGIDSVESVVTRVSDGTLWIGTVGDGLIVHDPATGKTNRYVHSTSDAHSLSDDLVRMVYEDPAGRIWVGSGRGLSLWDPAHSTFQFYPNPSFEKALYALPVGSDRKGRLWVRYVPPGLSLFDPVSGTFTNFNAAQGFCGTGTDLQVLDDGRFLLTGRGGVNIIHPDSLKYTRRAPQLLITQVVVNDSLAIPLPAAGTVGDLRLPYDQNLLELTFAAMDIDAPGLVEYEYRLKGLENDWVKPRDRRTARYPSLDPGHYTFMVRASSAWREWPSQEVAFAFSIAPPWWRTVWAYAAYVLLVAGLLFFFFWTRLQRMRLKQRLEMEHFQAEHLAEVDRLKSRFFSNISHEFRTPLTLILGPADQVIETTDESSTRQRLLLIKDNANKLFGLVNQLLDFARLESGMMRLQVCSGDLVLFLRRVVMSFESWAERKGIALEFKSDAESIPGHFDADKLEKIVNNLMSNAMKFTPEGGAVTVKVTEFRTLNSELRIQNSIPQCGIAVSDTGPGIAPEHLPHIFDRFYRADEAHTTEGTGIGLALTKELVDLHHGTINAESTPGKGSSFTVILPVGKSAYKPEEISESSVKVETQEHYETGAPADASRPVQPAPQIDGKAIVVVVEDNPDLRTYIREYLQATYGVQEAGNGKEGFDLATEIVPDLVISDVMMPEMDGIQLCRALKQDVRTSHVPVILLTARAGTDSKIEGLDIGADDYVTKPFDMKELLVRVRNLIEVRRQLRMKFSAGTVLKPGEVGVSSIDDVLLKNLMEAVEAKMGDEKFGVEELARSVSLGRRQLERKILGLTNLSPGGFIRYMRLQRAHELLRKNAGSVAEIAYQVGFSSHSHFSSSFHQQFGFPPSEIQRQIT